MTVLKYYNTATSAWEYIAASTTANFTTWKKTATGGETSVSGTDDNAVTLSYTVGLEQVFINGVLQVRGTDYTATTGTSITGLSALAANDVVTVICYAPFNVANTIAPTLVDAKGDLIAGTAADTVGRLAVGLNGQRLSADSTASTGLKWVNGGLTQMLSSSVTKGASGSASVDSIGNVTFSGTESISLNGCFSSTYDNYRILFFGTLSTGSNQTLRLRASGTDNSGATSYRSQQGTFGGASVAAKRNDTSAFNLNYDSGGSEPPYYVIDIFRPNSTDSVKVISGMGYKSAQADFTLGALTSSTQFDGFSLITSAGTMTGTVRVYGYNQ